MLTLWMLGALLTGLLAGASAMAAERALRLWRGATRWTWVVALGVAALLPAAALLLPRVVAPTRSGAAAVAAGAAAVLPPVVVVATTDRLQALAAWLAPLDAPLAAAWALLSLLALVRLAHGALALRRARRAWRRARVDATPVLVAPSVGPLVMGVRQPSVVLPEWALSLDTARRRLVLRHEAEHARARDPALLLAAAVAVALAPWNLALRWHARRLRLAVEVDCDARVLRAHPDVRGYALLLVDVARRAATRHPALAAAALVEPPSDLERRIAAMHPTRTRHRLLLTLLLGSGTVAGALGAFAACSVSDPTSPSAAASAERPNGALARVVRDSIDPVAAMRGDALAHPEALLPGHERPAGAPPPPPPASRMAPDAGPDTYFEYQVEQPVRPAPGNRGPRYPQALREAKVEGEVLAQFVIDTEGRMVPGTFHVLKSSDARFTEAVQTAVAEARYEPALVGGRPVRQVVQQPFQFQLTK